MAPELVAGGGYGGPIREKPPCALGDETLERLARKKDRLTSTTSQCHRKFYRAICIGFMRS